MALTSKQRKLTIFSLFFTFFVDNLSWAIVFPIFAPFFLDPKNLIFSHDISLATRTTIFGLFVAAFPIAQFFGSPIIGEYADRKGRKKALVYSVLFSFVGLALSAISLEIKMLSLLLISRLLTGAFAGNLSLCLTAIADLSKGEYNRVKNFGYLAVIAGFSFIIGTFVGGRFSDSEVSKSFSIALPLWIATALMFINFLFALFAFKETGKISQKKKFDLLEGFHNIQQALKTEDIKTIYIIYFLFLFSWNILLQFSPVHVIEEFHFTNSQIGNMAAFMGVCWAIGSGVINKFLLKWFSSLKILEFSLLAFTILCAFIIFPKNLTGLLIIIGICVVLAGIAWPICTNVISNKAGPHMQGRILGISQSMQSLAMALSPLSAVFAHIHPGVPFFVAALASLVAAIVYFRVKL